MAKQPSTSRLMIFFTYALWWRSVPRFSIAPPNRPHCTPALTISDRSDIASISILVTAAATSPLPPCSFLNPSCGAVGGHDLHLLGHLGAGDDGVRGVVRFE